MPVSSPFRRTIRTFAPVLLACASFPTDAQVTSPAPLSASTVKVPGKARRQAHSAYIAGAKLLVEGKPSAAEEAFGKAVSLDPSHTEYALSLAIARQHRIHDLLQTAETTRSQGKIKQAAGFVEQARLLDPQNPMLLEHELATSAGQAGTAPPNTPGEDLTQWNNLGAPVVLKPLPARRTLHQRGDTRSVVREVFQAYGLSATFDPSVKSAQLKFDLNDADFDTASRTALVMSHTFLVPLTANQVLLADDTQENRDRLEPQIEETVYLPSLPNEQLNELSNIAKSVFDLKRVQVGAQAGVLILRGNESALRLINATFADLVDGGADVLLNVHLYEIDKSRTRDIGAKLPTSAGAFNVTSTAQSVINQNQSLIQQGIAAGAINTSGSYAQTVINELAFLVAAGVSIPQLSGLLGTFGGGLTYSGVYLGSSTTFNFLLNSSEVRTFDSMQLRVGDNTDGIFRSGTRYPITTSTYSSSLNSSVASSSLSSLLSKYLNTSSVTIPQIQYEDLGLTLKAHPKVEKSGQIAIHLDMKIEALAGSSINNIPVLANRALVSDVTIREGQVALLASDISRSELGSIQGLPGLNELPGFQGTDKSKEHDSNELLITIEPHIVRRRFAITATRRLLANVSRPEQ